MSYPDYDPGFSAFIERVAQHPLLTADEEKALARRIQAGQVEDASDAELLDALRAKHELIRCNMKLVISIAKRFRRPTGHGLGFDELVQEGTIGLNRAAEKFNPNAGTKFSTYATWWIRQSLQRGMANTAHAIRVPVHVTGRRQKALFAVRENPNVTREALALILQCKVSQVDAALDAAEVITSVDKEYGFEDGGSMLDTIADPNSPDPFELVQDGHADLDRALAQLTELERAVITLRFGFYGHATSFRDIAEQLDLPQHRVKELQRSSLAALRAALSDQEAVA